MSTTLKCPKCGEVFSVDESEYAQLLDQVKTTELAAQVDERVRAEKAAMLAAQQLELANLKANFAKQLAQQEKATSEQANQVALLQDKINNFEQIKTAAVKEALATKEGELQKLRSDANNYALVQEMKYKEELAAKDLTISQMKSDVERRKQEVELEKTNTAALHKMEVDNLREELERARDFKARLSTKMLGETLEQHCANSYNQFVRQFLPSAYFEKDNDASDGTKGDFIFRNNVDGIETVSIMFEMKNEADETKTKHKNADFFHKLDEDRKKKKCEYAVLVSMLEADSDLYNSGIVAAPGYDKMYVIRPQFFLSILHMLIQSGNNTLAVRRELQKARAQTVDVTNFEAKLEDFKDKWSRNVHYAGQKFEDAIKNIDDAIKKMEAIKAALLDSEKYLEKSQKNTEELTIKKLTWNNPTMKQAFEDAANAASAASSPALDSSSDSAFNSSALDPSSDSAFNSSANASAEPSAPES